MKYDFLVVGAGFFGAVFAHEAKQAGKRVLVIDKRGHVGGNAYTEDTDGIPVHRYGAHIFHTNDEEVWNYVRRFARFNCFTNAPLAKYRDELYHLPFNMNTFHEMWGVHSPDEARAIIEAQRKEIAQEPANLEEQAISLVGRDMYEKLVKGYTEKQWGRPCDSLPAFIIRRLPVRFTYDNDYFGDRFQGIPENGYTPLFEKMLEGVDVRLNTDYSTVQREGLAERTIYTGPIDAYFGHCLGQLEYRSLRFETKTLRTTADFQGNAVVNYTEAEVPYTRIIEHKHFARGCPDILALPYTVISYEYPQCARQGDEPYYPVNDEKNGALYRRYKTLAEQERHVLFGGRLGSYQYLDMDDTVRMALDAARHILGPAEGR